MTETEDRLAGQRMMIGFNGRELNAELKFAIGTLQVGGLILFARNIASPKQLARLCTCAQAYAARCGLPPLFIAIDQEGGAVARLKWPFTEFPGRPPVRTLQDAEHFARVSAWELAVTGINMNLAPVLDLAPAGMKSIMSARSFGADPGQVAALGCCIIRMLQEQGIMAVAKHFPGIGRTVLDSHEDLPLMDRSREELEQYELLPFRAAIKQEAAGMMLSHILYPKLDSRRPASLSSRIAKKLLREEMGYEGLIMTDDLDMGAIGKHYDIVTAVEEILLADTDIILICHKGPNIGIAHGEILRHIRENPQLRKAGEKSVQRILKMKRKYRI